MNESENRSGDTNTSPVEPVTEVLDTAKEDTETQVAVDDTSVVEEAVPAVEAAPVAVETASTETEDNVTSAEETKTDVTPEVAATLSPLAQLKEKWNVRYTYTVVAVVIAAVFLLCILFLMERQGRIETGMFEGVNKILSRHTAVAKVNDGKVTEYDLNVSMSQIAAGAAAQGVDVESEEVKSEIQKQAIDMLVNTELLKQEAAAKGIVITDEDVENRIETLKTDVGGEEVLKQRMAEFNVTEKTLRRDVRNELTIQQLLDGVFKEKGVAVTEDEISAFYKEAGGEDAGLPELEAVRAQIEEQLRTTKEQEVVTAYIEELRKSATIEILI